MAGDDPSVSRHPTGGRTTSSKTRKDDMYLTGFIGWLRRVEKEEVPFWKEVQANQRNCDRRLEGKLRKTSFLNYWRIEKKKGSSQLEKEVIEVPNTAPNLIRTPKRKADIQSKNSPTKKQRIFTFSKSKLIDNKQISNSRIISSKLSSGTAEVERESLGD